MRYYFETLKLVQINNVKTTENSGVPTNSCLSMLRHARLGASWKLLKPFKEWIFTTDFCWIHVWNHEWRSRCISSWNKVRARVGQPRFRINTIKMFNLKQVVSIITVKERHRGLPVKSWSVFELYTTSGPAQHTPWAWADGLSCIAAPETSALART